MSRQQTRLYYSAVELAIKLEDDQHKRENTKEIKSLKYGVRALRIENKNIKREFQFREDSLRRSNRLFIISERNRHQEAEKTLKNDNRQLKRESYEVKRQQKIEKAKVKNLTYAIWVLGGVAFLFLVLLIVIRIKK